MKTVKFNVQNNQLFISYRYFEACIEPIIQYSMLKIKLAISKGNSKVVEHYYSTIEDAMEFLTEYDYQLKMENDD